MYYDNEQQYTDNELKTRPLFLYTVNPKTREHSNIWVNHNNMKDIIGLTITEIRSGDKGGLCDNMFGTCDFCTYLRSRITLRKEW